MMKPRIIIADTDENYIIPLQLKFVKEFFDAIDLEVITEKEYFDELFSKPQKAEILIISESMYDNSVQRHSIDNIFLMQEQYEEEETCALNVNRIFKYTSIKDIFNEIVGKSSEALKINPIEEKETQIILVTSAAGGVGKTTVAMGIASCLTTNYKKVLYVNASKLQNFQYLLNNKTYITSTDIYSKLLNPSENIYEDIKHIIRNEEFFYMPAFKNSLISMGLDNNIYEKIVLSAKKSGEYDYIVVDSESSFDNVKMRQLDIANKIIIITDQTYHGVFSTKRFVENINAGKTEKYFFVCNKFDKQKTNMLISTDINMGFEVNEYIRILPEDKITSIEELSQIEEIKKIVFLFN